jgi:DNA-binding NarL/FixJ family response regulator
MDWNMEETREQKSKPYRIVLADGHTLLREGLKRILGERVDLDVVGEAEDSVELLRLLKQFIPHMVIIDVTMPEGGGFELTRTIKSMYPAMKVLIVTMHKSYEYLRRALSAGADGYSLKEDMTAEIAMAVEMIRKGGIFISPLLAKRDY